MEGEKLNVSKASLDEHKEYMSRLMLEEIPEEYIALEKFIINPESIIGKRITQKFDNDLMEAKRSGKE